MPSNRPSADTPPGPPAWDEQRLYGRRQDKALKPRQARLMQSLLPTIAASPDNIQELIEQHHGPVWLEVGFGGGEHLAWHARQNDDALMIGAEPFVNGVAKLLLEIEAGGCENVRIRHGDVRPLMTAMPDGSLSRLFVLHPDPWPKSRHFKRRIISQEFLVEAARLLKSGCELRVSSDIADYVRWTLMQMQIFNREKTYFIWSAKSRDDWTVRPQDWPQTRYEVKALREGRTPTYLSFRRV